MVINNPNASGSIYYTLDGSNPDAKHAVKYDAPFSVDQTTLVRAIVVEEGKTQSKIAEGNYRLVSASKKPGVTYAIFQEERLSALPDFTNKKPKQSGVTKEFSTEVLDEISEVANTAVVFTAQLEVLTPGEYTFYTTSDDGSKLYVDNQLVVNNDGDHGVQERSGSVSLAKGKHTLKIEYFNGGGGYYLDAKYKGPGIGKQIIPADKLSQD